MEPEPPGWQRFTRPGFAVEFSYPPVTPRGHSVERSEEPFRDYARVHLSSPDRQELYVEVVRFHELQPEDEYRQHRAYLEQRFGSDSITPLARTKLLEWPAWAYGFRWDEGDRPMERAVLLLDIAGDTYRVIYDPRSPVNAQVLRTLELSRSSP